MSLPKSSRAFVFPGQGSQAVQMGKALCDTYPAARAVFEEVDEALSQNLSKLIFEGPEEDLNLTENTQPALMAVSLAVVKVLEHEGGFDLADKAKYVAGHSLGEYAALCATGALTLSDTARLLKTRGQAMQQAVPVGEGAMAAILGLDFDDVHKIADEADCTAANDNAPGQVVVSGRKATVEHAIELACAKGAKRAVLLPVSAPFHCDLMQPAAEAMAQALADTNIQAPRLPVVANVTAQPTQDPDIIRGLLVQQVTGTVRWRESVAFMAGEEITELVELGAGKVLCGLARRIDKNLAAISVGTPEEVDAFLNDV